eukprot:4627787-Pleurochrysis_carterae.AAC.1
MRPGTKRKRSHASVGYDLAVSAWLSECSSQGVIAGDKGRNGRGQLKTESQVASERGEWVDREREREE